MKAIKILLFLIFTISQAKAGVIIYEIYGGGGGGTGSNSSTYNQDYVVLFNNTSAPVDLSGWSLQYNTATSTTSNWDKLLLTGSIPANGFYTIAIGITTTSPFKGLVGANISSANLNWNFQNNGLASSAGKLSLLNISTTINTANPNTTVGISSSNIMDLVGYGSTSNAFENTTAPSSTNTNAVIRKSNGQDTNNNGVDFVLTGPSNPSALPSTTPPLVASSIDSTLRRAISVEGEVGNFGTAQKIKILSNGNVGLGTSNPTKLLTLANNAAALRLESVTAPTSYNTELINNLDAAEKFTLKIGGFKVFGEKAIFNGYPNTYMAGYYGVSFLTNTTSDVPAANVRMHINGNGNVGIGTTNPSKLLTIANNSATLRLESASDPASYSTELSNNYDAAERLTLKVGTSKLFGEKAIFNNFPNTYLSGYYGLSFLTNAPGDANADKVRMHINGDGNVGIGTTAPTTKLQVVGNTKILGNLFVNGNGENLSFLSFYDGRDNTSPYFGGFRYNNSSGWTEWRGYHNAIQINNAGYFDINKAANSSDGMAVSNLFRVQASSGNIGISQEFPRSRLEINSGVAGLSGLQFSNFNVNSPVTVSNGKALSVDADGKVILVSSSSSSTGIDSLFRNTFSVVNGKVGLGSTNPNYKLVINDIGSTIIGGNAISNSTIKGLNLNNSNNGNESVGIWFSTSNSHFSGISGQRSNSSSTWGTDLRFYTHEDATNDLTSTRERMRISSNGDIGIGTFNPTARLHLQGTQFKQNDESGSYGFTLNTTSSTSRLITLFGGSSFAIQTGGGAVDNLTINSAGNVAIGKTTPLAKLDVNGNVAIGFEGSLSYPVGYKLAVDGNIIAKKIKVKNSNAWPDFVFKKDYLLPSLADIEKYVNENNHLPDIPAASEIEKEGQDLGEMNRLLLKKVEELTLYLIQLKKENDQMTKRLDKLELSTVKK